MSSKRKVAVLHPDLGLGGAERLIVDLSRAIQELPGYSVKVYTNHHDPKRCFDETIDGTLDVTVVGGWIPRSLLGRCYALMAYLKMIYLALYLLLFESQQIIVCDQVSACLPFLKLKKDLKVIFYCHFPDMLLTDRRTLAKSFYRSFIDYIEERSMLYADVILANSEFTKTVIRQTFKSLHTRKIDILYPCVDLDRLQLARPLTEKNFDFECKFSQLIANKFTFLSINRFERKKRLEMALIGMKKLISTPPRQTRKTSAHLIMAGGYDPRLPECVEYFEELREMIAKLELHSVVTLVRSPDDVEKVILLNMCDVVLYTPENEHFGIVPLEAMACEKPVIACDSGGPKETITHTDTGLLFKGPPYEKEFAKSMIGLFHFPGIAFQMGVRGHEHVRNRFSFQSMINSIAKVLE